MRRSELLTTRTGTITDSGNLDALARRAPATDDLLALAAWLATNGPAHLSTIERIELAERLITRRRFIIGASGLLGAATLGACRTGEEGVAPTAMTATRTIEHAAGITEVPVNPQRIVVMDNMILDNMLALGTKPLAYATSEFYSNDGFAAYLDDAITGIEPIQGNQNEPDLELVAAQNPDLILGKTVHREIYTQLSQIAPTVLLDAGNANWKQDVLQVGEILGQVDKADQLVQMYEERVKSLREALDASPSIEVSVVVSATPDLAIIAPSGHFVDQVVQEVGLLRPQAQEDLDQENLAISLERLDIADGDVMFLIQRSSTNGEQSLVKQWDAENNPLWESLGVVEQGRVYEVTYEAWWAGRGITAANIVLDEIEVYLIEGGDL